MMNTFLRSGPLANTGSMVKFVMENLEVRQEKSKIAKTKTVNTF